MADDGGGMRSRWVPEAPNPPIKHVLACPLDPPVVGIGTELIEEHQVPHGAAVLRSVPRSGLHPPASLVLGGQDPGDRVHLHCVRPSLANLRIVGTATEQIPQRRRPHRRIGGFQEPRQRVLSENVRPVRSHGDKPAPVPPRHPGTCGTRSRPGCSNANRLRCRKPITRSASITPRFLGRPGSAPMRASPDGSLAILKIHNPALQVVG